MVQIFNGNNNNVEVKAKFFIEFDQRLKMQTAESLTITDKIFKKNSRKFQACKACDIAKLDYLFSILGESL